MTTWQDVQKNWLTFKPKFRTHWPKLAETEFDRIAGKRDVLVNALKTTYKITPVEADKQIDAFLKTLAPAKAKV